MRTDKRSDRFAAIDGTTGSAAEGADDTVKVPRRKSHGFGRLDRMRRRLPVTFGSCRLGRAGALLRDAERAG